MSAYSDLKDVVLNALDLARHHTTSMTPPALSKSNGEYWRGRREEAQFFVEQLLKAVEVMSANCKHKNIPDEDGWQVCPDCGKKFLCRKIQPDTE